MSERSVAEIIGWRLIPSDSPGTWPPMWHGPNGEVSPMPPRITVDDLLAWLTGQGYAVKPQTILPGNNITIEVWRGVDAVCQGTAPTLLAALELAVRAVAGES